MNDEQIKALREALSSAIESVRRYAAATDDMLTRLASAESRAERAEAEVARLTAAMPSARVAAVIETMCRAEHDAGVGDYVRDVADWLSRLPAPVATKESEHD